MSLNLKKIIEYIVKEKSPGPSPTFSMFHVFYALELISEKPIGRGRLAKQLKVGEGAIRTIITHLKEANLITTSRQGCNLTEKGLILWKNIEKMINKKRDDAGGLLTELGAVYVVANELGINLSEDKQRKAQP